MYGKNITHRKIYYILIFIVILYYLTFESLSLMFFIIKLYMCHYLSKVYNKYMYAYLII